MRRLGMPRAVLFVCHGNICRSPYAEGAFRRLARHAENGAPAASSAGFFGPNRPAPGAAVAVAGRRGVDLRTHRSRLLADRLMEGVDLIVVMNALQAAEIRRRFRVAADRVVVLGDLDPGPIAQREIADPVEQPEAAFEASYTRIDACLAQLAGALALRASEAPRA
jgi:protein-tyrosine phosphatase